MERKRDSTCRGWWFHARKDELVDNPRHGGAKLFPDFRIGFAETEDTMSVFISDGFLRAEAEQFPGDALGGKYDR